MGICSSKSDIHCEADAEIETVAIIADYNNPIISFKNHTIYITKLGSNPIKEDSKLTLSPDYANLQHMAPYNCQIYYYDHNSILDKIPDNYTQVELILYPINIPINTYIVEKKWFSDGKNWCCKKYYYVDKSIVSTWNIS